MYKIGEKEMVFCPYNRFHVVSKLRIQKHIIKCQKNYPNVKLATCFYNFTHRFKPEEMLSHYEICSHKRRIDSSRYAEPCGSSTSNARVNYETTEDFPDISAKPKIFTEPHALSSRFHDSGESDLSESESFLQIKNEIKSEDYLSGDCDSSDDNDGDDNDEDGGDNDNDDYDPLPLPKTISKAFVCVKQKQDESISDNSQVKMFGRGKTFSKISPAPSGASDYLKISNKNENSEKTKSEKKIPIFFLKDNGSSVPPAVFQYCHRLKPRSKLGSSASVTSSLFDDLSTLKSEEIISEGENTDEDNGNNDICQNFEKYLKT